jgi:N-acetylglucosaminyldiphosphoundecaprenol N-acetyl-beta-D-mannosaminyltransferase
MTDKTTKFPSIRILETKVDMVEIPVVMDIMAHWIEEEPDRVHHVVNTGMHGIMEAHKDPKFGATLDAADIIAPDGILAILVARFRGHRIRKQETGPDLLLRFSEIADCLGYKYYFYGDTTETLKVLSAKLNSDFPNLRIVGSESPPFRPATQEEDSATIDAINQAKPDVLWVGLGMPKQDQWIFDHRQALRVPVVVGAGASFKFTSGTVRRAPKLICNLGFEWLWRVAQEPTRVWRRVVLDSPRFIILVFLQMTGLRKFSKPQA